MSPTDWNDTNIGEAHLLFIRRFCTIYPQLAVGTQGWSGGLAQISERGGEIVDLPRGSRVYPHDESVSKAYSDGKRSGNITVAKLADTIVVRQEADIDKIASAIVYRIEMVQADYVMA